MIIQEIVNVKEEKTFYFHVTQVKIEFYLVRRVLNHSHIVVIAKVIAEAKVVKDAHLRRLQPTLQLLLPIRQMLQQ